MRFNENFVVDGLRIILKFNYFYFDGKYYHQLVGTAMGTTFAVVGSNLVIAYLEVKMFTMLPQIYPRDLVDIFIRNYFRFLDDISHKWLAKFDIQAFSEIINNLDPDMKFIMDNMSDNNNFLDVNIKVNTSNELDFDIYYKPTNSFGYLRYSSCHPRHTRDNIAISLAKRIIRIVTDNKDSRIDELISHLKDRDYPQRIIFSALNKVYSPAQPKQEEFITFNHTYNPHHQFDKQLIRNSLDRVNSDKLRKIFGKTKVLLTTRQPANLRKMLVRAKFEIEPIPRSPKLMGLFPCGKCVYCKKGYIKHTTELILERAGRKNIKWTYTRYFSCESVNVLYIVKAPCDKEFYLGKATVVKSRTAKHKSDVEHPQNSNCKKCTNHLRNISGLVEPYFELYPFFYVNEPQLRAFMEQRFIRRFKPTLNNYLM